MIKLTAYINTQKAFKGEVEGTVEGYGKCPNYMDMSICIMVHIWQVFPSHNIFSCGATQHLINYFRLYFCPKFFGKNLELQEGSRNFQNIL